MLKVKKSKNKLIPGSGDFAGSKDLSVSKNLRVFKDLSG
jgi:hypothetical protein